MAPRQKAASPRATPAATRRSRRDERSRPRLPRAMHPIFEAGELLGANGTAGVKSFGRDADFGAEPEFATIRELRGCVVQHDGGIDLTEKSGRGGLILGDDGVGMVRA